MKIMYVDVETTGLKRDRHSIWQIAGIITDGVKEEEFNINIAPYTDEPVSEVALEICGITKEKLYSFQPAEQAYIQFQSMIKRWVNPYDKSDKLYLCGYNADYDGDFIRHFLMYNGDKYFGSYFWYPVLDVMHLASWYFVGQRTQFENFKLSTVYKEVLGKPLVGAHDAFEDIKATRELLNALIKDFDLFKRKKD